MAKKTGITLESAGDSFFNLISKIDNGAEILAESTTAVISDYIDTGSYILNACMTGSLFKGLPCGRVTTLAGPSGCGKSYLAISICRNAQRKKYVPIYMDSEGAIDREFVERLGCDPSNFIIKQVTTITEVSTFIANLCKTEMELPPEKRHKFILVLDSLGNLTSSKELKDTIDGNDKADMTKQKEITALFRTNMTALSKLGAPFVVTSHTYSSMDFIPRQVVSGGTGIQYNASLTMQMTAAKLDDKESDKLAEKRIGEFTKTGVMVTAKPEKSRFTIPQKVKFQIPFFKAPNPYVGLESYVSWDICGIIRGKALTEKEFEKLPANEQKRAAEMKFASKDTGETLYAVQDDNSRNVVVRHLGGSVPIAELFTPKVMTQEVLKAIDEKA